MKQRKKVPTSEVLKESATDFCENTSLHGFSYWVSDGKYHILHTAHEKDFRKGHFVALKLHRTELFIATSSCL